MSDDDRAVGQPERLHPLFLVTGVGQTLRQMIGGYAAMGYLAASGKMGMALWVLVAMLVMMMGGVFLRWLRFEYRVGLAEIRIDSGILSRTHRSIPFDRIQDVHISQGPLARVLGLARVEFETGGSAGAQEDDGALSAIALGRAEQLRGQVRARRIPGAEMAAEASEADAARPLFAMNLGRVLLAGLFNFSLAVLAGLFGASQTFGDLAGIDVFARRFWRSTLDAGSPIADFILAHRITAAIAGAALLILVGIVAGVTRTFLREYGFRLERTGNGFRRRRGLLTLTDVTLPIRRIQAAVLSSGPVRANVGWRALKLQSLGKDGASSGDHVVAPLASEAEATVILAELGWDGIPPPEEWRRVSAAYGAGFTMVAAALLIPVALLMLIEPWAGLAGIVVLGIAVATRWLEWRRYGYAFQHECLFVRSGWWRRRTVILPTSSVQSVDLKENFIGRRFGVASLGIGVASGRGYSGHGIAALPAETARALRRRLLAGFE